MTERASSNVKRLKVAIYTGLRQQTSALQRLWEEGLKKKKTMSVRRAQRTQRTFCAAPYRSGRPGRRRRLAVRNPKFLVVVVVSDSLPCDIVTVVVVVRSSSSSPHGSCRCRRRAALVVVDVTAVRSSSFSPRGRCRRRYLFIVKLQPLSSSCGASSPSLRRSIRGWVRAITAVVATTCGDGAEAVAYARAGGLC